MKKIILITILLIFTTTIFSQKKKKGKSTSYATLNFTSLTVPKQYEGEIKYLDSSGIVSSRNIDDVVHDVSLLNSFPNIVSSVTIYESNI